MMDESVIFEIQVEKKVLEQVFHENKHLKDSYDKLIKNEDNIKPLKDEIKNLNNKTKTLQEANQALSEENAKMKKQFEEFEQTKNEEIKQLKERLRKREEENRNLDQDKLDLELQVKNLTRKVRLEEEKEKSNDLAQVECKLLKLKLHAIENEKNYLISDFERERKIITKQNKPRVQKLEENLRHLRKWIEKESRERRPRDTDQVKALKAQIATLENDKVDLIEGFELERKVFRKILKENGHSNSELS
ncbi:golgin subfamily A member 6-like protein 22 [Tribolium madens]|uniref:golgin subfamily A member 6-like protein 22 n=1 Tax=Tribolium madens TaxID=41895 RepID=UPI001CF75A81|nr:golgin subfamily A member 6-like protein 22 [Tribolium madens]XP_044261265.1 golgin subfamily A member 6-like protein 22 [Tribolium madens]